MTDVLKHRFVSPHTDGSDLTQVQPSAWNDGHKFIGGAEGDLLTRTLADPSFGAKWAPPGPAWQDVPFSAANFSAAAPMTWTVGAGAIVRNRYAAIGKILYWSFYVSWFSGGNVLSGSPSATLSITYPAGLTTSGNQMQLITYAAGIAGVPVLAGLQVTIGVGRIDITKSTAGNFALTDIPGLVTTLACEVL